MEICKKVKSYFKIKTTKVLFNDLTIFIYSINFGHTIWSYIWWVFLKCSFSVRTSLKLFPQTIQGGLRWYASPECASWKWRLAEPAVANALPQIKQWLLDILLESAMGQFDKIFRTLKFKICKNHNHNLFLLFYKFWSYNFS